MIASHSCAKLSWDSSRVVTALVSSLPSRSMIYEMLDIVQQEIQPYRENRHNPQEKVQALMW